MSWKIDLININHLISLWHFEHYFQLLVARYKADQTYVNGYKWTEPFITATKERSYI